MNQSPTVTRHHPQTTTSTRARLTALFAAILAGAAATATQADTTLEYQSTAGAHGMKRLMIKDGQLRVDIGDGDWLLFRSGEQAMTFVDTSDQSYMVMDQAMLDKIGGAMDAAKAEMEAALAQLPASQRKQMRQMMQGAMNSIAGGGESVEISVHDTGDSDQANAIDCRIMEIRHNDQPAGSICLASADDMDISGRDARVFADWAAYAETMMEKLAEQASGLIPFKAPSLGAVSGGLPIITIDDDGDRTQLSQHNTDALDDALFQIPEDYEQESMEVGL